MSIGSVVRRLLGPFESPATDLYRSYFVSLKQLGRVLTSLSAVEHILEVGCGGGQMANHVAEAFPGADYQGIDVIDEPGTLYTGRLRRATFRCLRLENLPPVEAYDLVLFVDVLHHVPIDKRESLLREARLRLRPGGFLAIKDWEPLANLAHLFCYISDRFLSRSQAWFPSRQELLQLLARACPSDPILFETRIRPQPNNILLIIQKAARDSTTNLS